MTSEQPNRPFGAATFVNPPTEQTIPPITGFGDQTPAAGAAPRPVSAFADIPITDYIRDGLAVVLILLGMFLPWTVEVGVGVDGTNPGLIVLIILLGLLSIASVFVPYLARMGVLGAQPSRSLVRAIKLLANVPIFLMVVGYVINAIVMGVIHSDDSRFLGSAGSVGLSVGAWFGIAGALLAAQPRTADLDPATPGRWLTAMKYLMVAAGIFTALTGLLGLVLLLIVADDHSFDYAADFTVKGAVLILLGTSGSVAVIATAAVGTFRQTASWRITLVAFGASALVGAVFVPATSFDEVGERSPFEPNLALLLVIAAAVCASVPRPAWMPAPPTKEVGQDFLMAARNALLLLTIWAFAEAIVSIAIGAMFSFVRIELAPGITMLLAGGVALGGFLMLGSARTATTGPRPSREGTLALCAGLLILLISALITVGAVDMISVDVPMTVIAPIFVVATALLVVVPREVRQLYEGKGLFSTITVPGPAAAQTHPYGAMSAPPQSVSEYPQRQHPVQPQHHVQQPTTRLDTDRIAAESAATTPNDLRRIAAMRADLHPSIANNPNTDPELLNWLQGLRNPQVDAALAARNPQQTSTAAPAASDADAIAVITPTTPAAELHRIAGSRPDLHAAIAAHPNAYPDLLAWLDSLHDR